MCRPFRRPVITLIMIFVTIIIIQSRLYKYSISAYLYHNPAICTKSARKHQLINSGLSITSLRLSRSVLKILPDISQYLFTEQSKCLLRPTGRIIDTEHLRMM